MWVSSRDKVKGRIRVKKSLDLLKESVFVKFGTKCANPACQWLNSDGSRGCKDRRCLQIDHVNNDGYSDRRAKLSRHLFLRKVLADEIGAYQLLCANCNWIKRFENEENKRRG
jgi:hypothetical protein